MFRSDLHTYCTHLLRLFARIYICQLFYLFVVFKVVESTTTPKLSGAVLFFSYVANAILFFFVCLFVFFFIDEAANCFPSERSRYSSTPD